MNVSFLFRTYEDKGMMFYHDFTSRGYVKLYLEEGKVKVEIKTDDNPRAILDNYDEQFNDGRWHSLVLTIAKNSLVLDIDQRPMRTTRLLSMTTGGVYLIAGGKTKDGFVGCMRMISIDGNYRIPSEWKVSCGPHNLLRQFGCKNFYFKFQDDEYCCKDEVVFNSCHTIDRCNPNPCKHGGICRQNSMEFFCDCQNTGYAGAVCHTCKCFMSTRVLFIL